jgi:hypothetical protein
MTRSMRKGSEGGGLSVVIGFLMSWQMLIAIPIIIATLFVLPLLVTNPCWKKVAAGLSPFELQKGADKGLVKDENRAKFVFDAECVDRFVITSSEDRCKLACNVVGDQNEKLKCAEDCVKGEDGIGTFIIAVPVDDPSLRKRVGKALWRGIGWLFKGKTTVFFLQCELGAFQITEPDGCEKDEDKCRCKKELNEWVCSPLKDDEKDKAVGFYIDLKRNENICDIVATGMHYVS